MGAETVFIGCLLLSEILRMQYNMICQEMSNRLEAADSNLEMMQYSVYVCSTW